MKTIKICNKLLILDLLTLSFFCSTYCDKSHSSEISPDFEIVQYSSESEWLNLLYYQPTGTGRFSSLVTHKSFFLSPNGQVDPYSELQETIRIFQTSDHGMAVHPQCALPARYEILSRRFRLLPPVKCQELETWISSYEPRGIDLVFTSQFVSNPASVFGHAFLLIPSKAKAEALWYTFNFAAAIPSDVDPFSYIFGGLTGWYQGDYSLLPYYQRLYQYGSIENRDLWRYPLNVSESEMILIIKHFWELIHLGKFSYYFLDQNCAGFILLSLAATLPDLAALSQLDTYVHPVDVIKTLRLKGRLKNPQMVPSSFEILKRRYDSLSQKDRKEFNLAISKNIVSMDQISFEVLECLTDYIAMQRLKNNELLPHDLEDLERRIFLARAKRPPRIQSDEVNLNPPDQSHNSHLGTLGFMRRDLDSFLSIGYRPTLHSLLDYDAGYLENSSVEVLSTKINVKANQTDLKFSLKDLTILNLETYSDFYNFDPKASWKIKINAMENPFEVNRQRHLMKGLFEYGASMSIGKKFTGFSMGSLELTSQGPESSLYFGATVGGLFRYRQIQADVRSSWLANPIGRGDNRKIYSSVGIATPISMQQALSVFLKKTCLSQSNWCVSDYDLDFKFYF